MPINVTRRCGGYSLTGGVEVGDSLCEAVSKLELTVKMAKEQGLLPEDFKVKVFLGGDLYLFDEPIEVEGLKFSRALVKVPADKLPESIMNAAPAWLWVKEHVGRKPAKEEKIAKKSVNMIAGYKQRRSLSKRVKRSLTLDTFRD